MIIGNFKSTDNGYQGVIRTLAFTTEAVFEPAEKRSENSPDFRITNGETEIGVAWKDISEAGNPYLSVRLDGPALPAGVYCALVKTDIEQAFSLVWERKRKRA
jgi:uncharacterized protein (DUF736 family)